MLPSGWVSSVGGAGGRSGSSRSPVSLLGDSERIRHRLELDAATASVRARAPGRVPPVALDAEVSAAAPAPSTCRSTLLSHSRVAVRGSETVALPHGCLCRQVVLATIWFKHRFAHSCPASEAANMTSMAITWYRCCVRTCSGEKNGCELQV